MTDLSRERIEEVRQGFPHSEALSAICDMALAKKDAEAECERLREQAEEMAKRQAITQYWLDRANSTISAMSLDKALATPPPESEPEKCPKCKGKGRTPFSRGLHGEVVCSCCDGSGVASIDAPHTPEQTEGMVEPSHDVLQSALRRSAKKVYPPEQTGDALAALDRVRVQGHAIVTTQEDTDSWLGDIETIRRHLTASGVPEEVRRLPSRWRGAPVLDTKCAEAYRKTLEHCADELERALASAPADGWWKAGDHVEFVTDEITDKGPCTGRIRWVLDGLACIELADDFVHIRWSEIGNFRMARHHRTGWPLWIVGESAAAPTDGREHD